MSWLCSCGFHNSGLSDKCVAVVIDRKRNIEHHQISTNSPSFLRAVAILNEVNGYKGKLKMAEANDLFKEYYNAERILVAAMNYEQRQAHIEQLEKIAFEAKTRVVAAKDHDREEKAKLSVANKAWISSRPDTDINSNAVIRDAQAVVTNRKARMSKMDKIAAQLEGAGIDEETRKVMIAAMEARMTQSASKTITFKSKEAPKVESTKIAIVPASKAEENKKPFDASTLVFDIKKD